MLNVRGLQPRLTTIVYFSEFELVFLERLLGQQLVGFLAI